MTTLKNKKVAVVGAGLAGLSAAYQLEKDGAEVTVLEAVDYVGGRTRSVRIKDYCFDLGALVILPRYKNIYRICRELGIDKLLHKTKPSLAIVRDGRLHSFDYARPLRSALTTRIISFASKLKIVKVLPTIIRHRKLFNYENMGDTAPFDKESTQEYCLRVLNEEVDMYFADPFIRINSLTSTRDAPAGEWLWQLTAYNTNHIFQNENGMSYFAEKLASMLDVKLQHPVKKVVQAGAGVTVEYSDDTNTAHNEQFDACVITTPPTVAREISPALTPEQDRLFQSVKPVPMISLHLGLTRRPDIDDSIIMFPECEHPDLVDILLDHNKGPGRAPEGKAAIAIQTSIAWSEAHADDNDEAITEQLIHLAEPWLGDIREHIEVSYVNRWDYVCAITYPGFFTRVRDFVAAHRKDQPIHYAGDYIVLGMEGATTSGLNAARQVKQYLRSTDRR